MVKILFSIMWILWKSIIFEDYISKAIEKAELDYRDETDKDPNTKAYMEWKATMPYAEKWGLWTSTGRKLMYGNFQNA